MSKISTTFSPTPVPDGCLPTRRLGTPNPSPRQRRGRGGVEGCGQCVREVRELRRHLDSLVKEVGAFIDLLDAEMQKPSTLERGKTIARFSNMLEMAKDRALHFGLGKPLRKSKRKTEETP